MADTSKPRRQGKRGGESVNQRNIFFEILNYENGVEEPKLKEKIRGLYNITDYTIKDHLENLSKLSLIYNIESRNGYPNIWSVSSDVPRVVPYTFGKMEGRDPPKNADKTIILPGFRKFILDDVCTVFKGNFWNTDNLIKIPWEVREFIKEGLFLSPTAIIHIAGKEPFVHAWYKTVYADSFLTPLYKETPIRF
jgi:hypothetical protein